MRFKIKYHPSIFEKIQNFQIDKQFVDCFDRMARTKYNFSFDMCCEIKFKTAIRGHHVWTPCQEEWLVCKKDNRQEALNHDPNAVRVYKESSEEDSSLALVGHVPIELSRLPAGFLGASKKHSVSAKSVGREKREVGLIVPGLYRARTKKRKFGKILVKEMKKLQSVMTSV